jgi:DNA adenine methylase
MKYMGSKSRHAKEILPIILADRKQGQWYVEPFVGGANVIDKVDGKRIGADSNEYLIALLVALQDGWLPPTEVSVEQYKHIRDNKGDYPKELVGYVGFPCSYGARFFEGYCRGNKKDGEPRDYIMEAWRNVTKQELTGIKFIHSSYLQLDIPADSVIYCDPPYAGTKQYRDKFNHDQFWQWCRDKVAEGHQVFVSEYNAPYDFICVWEKTVNSSLTANTGSKKATEKLFTLEQK